MRIALYGAGKYYINRRNEVATLFADDEVVALFDNKFYTETKVDGISAMNPSQIPSVKFDCIVIMSIHVEEIYGLLCKLGVDKGKIYTWKEYRAEKTGGVIDKYDAMQPGSGEKILIISIPVSYTGGSMTAIYAAMALRSRNYCVCLATEFIEIELKERLLTDGINLAICPDIPYIGKQFKEWIESFSVVIVNVFPNIHSVVELGNTRPVVWWLHENDIYGKIYQKTFEMFPRYREKIEIESVNVVAVSDKARNNFKRYYPDIGVRIMPYGLPDDVKITNGTNIKHKKMIFAIIGYVSLLKGQDIFLEAIKRLDDEERNMSEFWFVGSVEGDFAQGLLREAREISAIEIKGVVNRLQMKDILSSLDVVVSASREDALPIVITEGMMNSKACIISDAIGSVKYIKDMENGIIFRSQDVDDLANKMRWCLNNRDMLEKMGIKARTTYEKYFSMESFADNLEQEIIHAKSKFIEVRNMAMWEV